MNLLSQESLAAYWSMQEVETNLIVFMNLLGALLLGILVGYERSYHGRATGMRTYGLVCMASAALAVIVGYPTSTCRTPGTKAARAGTRCAIDRIARSRR